MHNRSVVFAVAAIAFGLPQIVSAAGAPTTFNFTGTCSDCSGTGTATLVLSNYTLGTPITTSNFISFTYNGTNLQSAFTITSSAPSLNVSGSITTIPGQNTVSITSSLFDAIEFTSSTNGHWFVGFSDTGSTSLWTGTGVPATPAPPTITLITTGLLALLAFLKRQRQTA